MGECNLEGNGQRKAALKKNLARYWGNRDISEKDFAGTRATRVPGMFQNMWLEPRERRETGWGREEEQRRSAGQGLAGRHKDFGFFLQALRSHRSVLSRGGRDLTLIFPTERNLVTK